MILRKPSRKPFEHPKTCAESKKNARQRNRKVFTERSSHKN